MNTPATPHGVPYTPEVAAYLNREEIKIEHDIPMPETRTGRGRTALGEAIRKMAVGDSITVNERQRSIAVSLARYLQIKLVTRRISFGADESIRIWRTK